MADVSEPLVPSRSEPSEPRASILLADDNPVNLLSLRAILEDLGQNLVDARSGEEALERIRAEEFAVVLLDVLMPGVGGFETARAIRGHERSQQTPIIFLTASDIDRSQTEEAYRLGAVDFLVKPLLPAVLQAKVRAFVELFQDKQRARHEADQLRLLVHGTTEYAIFMLDPQGHVLTWNPGAERIKGYAADEIIGQHFTRFYPQDALDRGWPAHELKVAAAEGRFEDEGWRLRKDGSRFWANVVITALRDGRGGLRGFSKVTRDLTARKQAEEALRRSEERFRLIVESAKDYAIFMLDPQGHVASWNPGAERIKGYAADEIIGQHFTRFYPQEALDRGWPDYELKVAAAEGRFEDEGWRVRKDGTQFWANVVITALKDERGDLLGFSKITRDLTARKQAEEDARRLAEETAARQVAHEERERLRVTLASIGDAVISTDAEGRVAFLNPIAEELVGWKSGEAAGQTLEDVFRIVNEDTRQPVENPALRALRDGKIVGLANHTVLISKDGAERPIDDSAAPIRNERGDISGSVLVFRDISERKRNEAALAERMRLLALNAAVGEALVQGDGLGPVLQRCAEALVKHLDGAFARIWTLNEAEAVLELRASAGLYTHLDGPHSRVPVGKYKIGQIARERQPHLTNAVVGDPRVSDQEWAKREGMVAFAGYPLVIDGRLVGVVAMFARRPLTEATLGAIASVADEIAIGIERKSSQERLDEQREWLSVTLASIGDAVIATDERGRVTFLNGVAQGLTGWAAEDAEGKPLEAVFRILNEQTRQPVENPVEKVLREGVIVGLGNHTVLVARDGTERPIDDSAAPIRDSAGGLIGVVLIFRDVTEQRRAEQELREQTANAEALLRVASLLAQEHDLDRLVQVVTDECTRQCGAQFGAFFYNVVGDRGEAYTLYTLSGVPREAFARFPMPRNTALFGPTFRGEGVVRLDDVTQDSRYGKSGPHFGMPEGHLPVRSYLALPVVSRTGEVLGGLFFGHAEAGVFTARHERLLMGIAGQAAVAIDNARLYQRTQASAERLNLALSAADLGDWSWDAASDVVTFSERAADVFGIPPGPHLTWTAMQDLLHPADRDRARREVERVVAERKQYDIEYRLNGQGGRQVWVGVLGRAVYDAADQVVGMYGVVQDVTRRKRSEQTARFLADASAALAVLVDFDSTLQKVASLAVPHFADWTTVDLVENGGTLRRVAVAHVDPAKVELAHKVHRRFPPDPAAPQGVWNILRTGRAEIIPEITDDLLVQSIKDEERLGIVRELGLKSYIGVPLKVRGKPLGVLTFIAAESGHRYDEADLATAQDLADRAAIAVENAQLYRELREADRRKDEFLATLAHELRNPLAPIRNGLQVLRLAGGGGEMAAEARSMMERQLGQMVRLVDDLLDVSRITRNKLELRKERVALATVAHSAVETSRPLMEQFGHTFSLTLPPSPVYLDADLTRLAQVFSNLLNNAAKYTEPGGRISLTAEVAEGEVVVRVRDTGLGIPADALPRIFEMFSQVDRNLERAQGGLGIGLTLVRRLVEMHCGTVEARSEGPGRGSEFTVRLPVLRGMAQQAVGSANDQGMAAGPKRRILVVDDNQDSAMSLGMMLRLMGNEVHTAHDGLAAVEAAQEFRPDIILLDIGLPKLNGYDACRRIREQPWSKGVVIVALTGWGQEEDRRRSQEAGFDHHLVKPVEVAALQGILQSASAS